MSAALAAALQMLTGLTRLKAVECNSLVAMVPFAPALIGMLRLQVLDLHDPSMSAEGTAALAAVLPSLAGSLTHLHLSHSRIDVEAAASALAPALAKTSSLTELCLKNLKPLGQEWLAMVPILSERPATPRWQACAKFT